MKREIVEAAGDLGTHDRLREINKDRTTWSLAEWSNYFTPKPARVMQPDEIAAAVLWLREHEYPIPIDCPKRPEASPYAFDGGCPVFKPMCLIYPVCQMARGMCNEVSTIHKCPTCHEDFAESSLRNDISRREFEISGMCQECQDKTFGRD